MKFFKAFVWAEHLHLRCPGNFGLIGSVIQIFFPSKPKSVKYAGNWEPSAKKPWTYKLQSWILSNSFLTRNMTVLVYGDWPDQTKNILPFFTASFSDKEIEKIEKKFSAPYKFLFVGNLVPGKQPLFALHLVQALKEKNIEAELHVYGEGEMMHAMKQKAENKAYIHLHGNQPLDILKQAYKKSHFLVLPSKSEGWPKVVAEAMFFGCIPIATAVSCVPWMLGGGSRGILIPGKEQRKEKKGKAGDNKVDSGQRSVNSWDGKKKGNSGQPPASGVQAGYAPTDRSGGSLPEPLGAGMHNQDVEEKLPDTFQKNRQFECFPKTTEAVSENVSRTGFSETPTSGINNEWDDRLEETLQKIIELINNPEEMKRISLEAQGWSQEYTLERFEDAIKEVLAQSTKQNKKR